MALPEALLFAARSWPHLREQIEMEDLTLIREHLAAAVHGADWDPGQLVEALFAHAEEGYPGWEALAERPARGAATLEPPRLVAAAAMLRFRIEEDFWTRYLDRIEELVETTDPEQVERDAEERLWIAPMIPLPAEAEEADLVVLERDGERVAPAFQFAGQSEVIIRVFDLAPGVDSVNRLLGASEDPWGAASWWLSPHAALHAIPADALRTGEVESVTAAARAIDEIP